ncbi:MAG TPA: hypothetical protein VIO60_08355, partial [Rectinemataceae bacterium]
MDSTKPMPLFCTLSAIEPDQASPTSGDRVMEFHVHAAIRSAIGLDSALFRSTGNIILADFASARAFAHKLRERKQVNGADTASVSAG